MKMMTLHDYNALDSGSNVPHQIKDLLDQVELMERSNIDGLQPETRDAIIAIVNAISAIINSWVQNIGVFVQYDPASGDATYPTPHTSATHPMLDRMNGEKATQ